MAKITVVLYISKKYKDGSSPIMLRLTKNRQLKYFKIGDDRFNISRVHWHESKHLVNTKDYKTTIKEKDKKGNKKDVKVDKKKHSDCAFLNEYIIEKYSQALKILRKFEESGVAWTFNMFEQEYRKKPKINKVKPFIETRIEELNNQGKYKSATGLKEALHIIQKHEPNFNKLYFQDIDYKFIESFFYYLKNERGNSDTTIGIMMRGIRAILNEAINRGVGSKEAYPFSKIYGATQIFKISKLKKRANKRFIPKEYMLKLVNSEILEPHLNWAKQIFLFSFFASGINFKDMAYLKETNIKTRNYENGKEQKYIDFNRKKTNENISIPITEDLKQIISWAKEHTTNDNEYLLPIITNKNLRGEKLDNHISQRRKRMNKHLRTIAKRLKFPEGLVNISSYYARHSYATTLLRNGAQIEKISEALGHKSTKTTQIYLESFGTEEIAKLNENLLK